jgi:hypothetical protein
MATGFLLAIGAACSDDGIGPSQEAGLGGDSGASPHVDSTLVIPDSTTIVWPSAVILDKNAAGPGITLGTWNMPTSALGSVHTGTTAGGSVTDRNVLSLLAGVRAKGGRIIVKMCMGRDEFVKNGDGTFSFTKWKALVDRYRRVNLRPYIDDGTLLAHFLIDEPGRAAKWGGKVIPPATLEAMAKYSRQIWPGLTTIIGEEATRLASSPGNYTYLDAAWGQYTSKKGDATRWVAAEVAAAKRKGLGLALGMNVLAGGDGSSRIRGWKAGTWAMSASELRKYGSALLAQSYGCALYSWTYDANYYGRSDVKSAMADLSAKARKHAKTSCRQ